jgi:beta-lactamase class A
MRHGRPNTARIALSTLALVATLGFSPEPAGAQGRARVAAAPSDSALSGLQRRIAALAAAFDGDVGVAALHVESGRGVAAAGDRPFFLASVYKLPIAVALLRRVEAGSLALSDSVRLAPWDFRIGRATLEPNRPGGAGTYTLTRLLDAMLTDSDNTASDALLALAGGPRAVTDTLSALGLDGIRIDRSEGETLFEFYGLPDSVPVDDRTPARVSALVRASPREANADAVAQFAAEPGDAASALALAELLDRLWRGELLSATGTRLLLDRLRNSAIETRIVAGVPPGTAVWHKTGTYGPAATHDAGIVELPDGTHLALAILVRQPKRDTGAAERAIAAITRAAWDVWADPPGLDPAGEQAGD